MVTQQFVERKPKKNPPSDGIGTNFRVSSPQALSPTSTGSGRRRWACRFPRSLTRSRRTSAISISTTSSNSAGCITCRRKPRPSTDRLLQDISKIYVRSTNPPATALSGRGASGIGGAGPGENMIPLDTVVRRSTTSGPDPVTHLTGTTPRVLLGAAAPGYSSGQALEALSEWRKKCWFRKATPWNGAIFPFRKRRVGGQSGLVFVIGLLMVFLVLAAQFESWAVPFAVILAVPFASVRRLVRRLDSRDDE